MKQRTDVNNDKEAQPIDLIADSGEMMDSESDNDIATITEGQKAVSEFGIPRLKDRNDLVDLLAKGPVFRKDNFIHVALNHWGGWKK